MHSRDIPELLGLLFGTGEVQHRLPVLVCVALTLWRNGEKRGGGGRKRGGIYKATHFMLSKRLSN